ncbi:MAG TPA: hypothetical protein VGG39_02325 [Polyangiaceae bacterium]
MNRWSTQAIDEGAERALFERRAQALRAPEVPPLASVLAAADARGDAGTHASARAARARVMVALTLAAACLAGVFVRVPRPGGPSSIVADVDAGSPRRGTQAAASPLAPVAQAETCTLSDPGNASETSACFTPAAPVAQASLFTPFTPAAGVPRVAAVPPAAPVRDVAPPSPATPVSYDHPGDDDSACELRTTCEACGSCEGDTP